MLTIQFGHTVKKFQVLLINTNNSIQRYSFVSKQLNGRRLLLLTIQLNKNHLLVHSLNGQTVLFDPSGATTPDQSGSRNKGRGTPHSAKFQDWSLTIRLFNIIFRILVGPVFYPSTEIQSVYSTVQANWAEGIISLLEYLVNSTP